MHFFVFRYTFTFTLFVFWSEEYFHLQWMILEDPFILFGPWWGLPRICHQQSLLQIQILQTWLWRNGPIKRKVKHQKIEASWVLERYPFEKLHRTQLSS